KGSVLYFLARDSSGRVQVWRAVPTGSGQRPAVSQVTQLTEKAVGLTELHVSGDGNQVSYLLRSEPRGVTELHVVDIPRMKDDVVFSDAAGRKLTSPGWTAKDSVVVLRSEPATSTTVLVVTAAKTREVGRFRDATLGSGTLYPRRDVLYFGRLRGQVRSLHAFSLASGPERQVFEGEPFGPAFSGMRVLDDGRLLFSYQR